MPVIVLPAPAVDPPIVTFDAPSMIIPLALPEMVLPWTVISTLPATK